MGKEGTHGILQFIRAVYLRVGWLEDKYKDKTLSMSSLRTAEWQCYRDTDTYCTSGENLVGGRNEN